MSDIAQRQESTRQGFQVGDLIRRRYGIYRYRVLAMAPNGALFCVAEQQPSIQMRFMPDEQSTLERIAKTQEVEAPEA